MGGKSGLVAADDRGCPRHTLLDAEFCILASRQEAHPGRLGTMRAFINCSETVFHADMAGFVACHGLRTSQVTTSYAHAEKVFAATQSEPGQPPRTLRVQPGALARNRVLPSGSRQTDQLLTSCGKPVPDMEIGIVPAAVRRSGKSCCEAPARYRPTTDRRIDMLCPVFTALSSLNRPRQEGPFPVRDDERRPCWRRVYGLM